MRARMLGDAAKVALIEAQLAALAAAAAAGAPPQLPQQHQHLKRAREEAAAPPPPAPAGPVLVSTLDARGRPIASLQSAPAGIARDDLRGGSRGGKLSAVPSLIGPRGERLGYFPEDVVQGGGGGGGGGAAAGSAALAAEAARVRGVAAALARGDASAEGGEDMASRLARNIAGNARYRGEGRRDGSGRGEGEEEDEAGGGGAAALLAARGARLTERERQARDMARAVAAHREGERAVARCGLCSEGGALRGGCVVSRGRHCLLALPPGGQRFPGHLVLAPVAHVATATDMVRGWAGVGRRGARARVCVCVPAHFSPRAPLRAHCSHRLHSLLARHAALFFLLACRRRRRCTRSSTPTSLRCTATTPRSRRAWCFWRLP